ncbi:MAG: hypothetical protein AB1816_11935, partial [Bacillota bacterium]
KYAARTRRHEWAEPLLELVEPLLTDPHPYVRRNLGPFVIGDQLLRSYPAQTLARLYRWAERPDAVTRWNVAMVFTSAEGRRHREAGMRILEILASDTRSPVARAVAAARRRLGEEGQAPRDLRGNGPGPPPG